MLEIEEMEKLNNFIDKSYTKIPNSLLDCNKLNGEQCRLLLLLLRYKNLKNINLSISFLCKKLNLSKPTIVKVTNSLIKLKIISKENITNDGKKTNDYKIILHGDNLTNLINDGNDFIDEDIQTPQQDIKNAPRGITKQINSIEEKTNEIIDKITQDPNIKIINKQQVIKNIYKLVENGATEEGIMLVYNYVINNDWYIDNAYNNLEVATNPDKFDSKLEKAKAKKQKEQSRQYININNYH